MYATRKFPLLIAGLLVVAACGNKAKKADTTAQAPPEAPAPAVDRDPVEPDVDTAEAEPELTLSPAYFAYDSAALSEDAREILQDDARWLEQHPDVRVVVEGHADENGSDEYNLALGDERARAVKQYLVRLGIDESRLRPVSYGEEKPASATNDALNRRAVIVPQADQARR